VAGRRDIVLEPRDAPTVSGRASGRRGHRIGRTVIRMARRDGQPILGDGPVPRAGVSCRPRSNAMSQPSASDEAAGGPPSQASRLRPKLHALAERGVFFGTSSWKYEGWLGSIYSPDRYRTRGKFSKKKFEAECLAEYAETFPTVCGDFAFYQFPSADYSLRLFDGTPALLSLGLTGHPAS